MTFVQHTDFHKYMCQLKNKMKFITNFYDLIAKKTLKCFCHRNKSNKQHIKMNIYGKYIHNSKYECSGKWKYAITDNIIQNHKRNKKWKKCFIIVYFLVRFSFVLRTNKTIFNLKS